MAVNRNGVAGLFTDESHAEQALNDLKAAGFTDQDVGVAMGGSPGEEMSGSLGQGMSADEAARETHPGLWQKIKGLFGGRTHYANGEELTGTFESLGVPSAEARYFEDALPRGGVVVTVECSGDRAREAEAILARNGADLGATAADYQPTSRSGADRPNRVRLLGEVLRVYKERVARGEVTVHKEVVTSQQTLQVPVTREEVVIERHPIEARDAGTGASVGESKEIRIPVSEEQVRVEKKPVVTGEVTIEKRPIEETKNVSDSVRHEELKVDREGDVDVKDDLGDVPRRKSA